MQRGNELFCGLGAVAAVPRGNWPPQFPGSWNCQLGHVSVTWVHVTFEDLLDFIKLGFTRVHLVSSSELVI
jgi:hypothetical protein